MNRRSPDGSTSAGQIGVGNSGVWSFNVRWSGAGVISRDEWRMMPLNPKRFKDNFQFPKGDRND